VKNRQRESRENQGHVASVSAVHATLIETIFSDLKEKGALEELRDSEDLKDVEDSMSQIKLQIDRCAKITQSILRFGRQSDSAPKDIDLSIFIPEVLGMIEKKAAVHGIKLERDILPHTPPIHVDGSQLQQVLINLFNNAMDAIVDRHGSEGGELRMYADRVSHICSGARDG